MALFYRRLNAQSTIPYLARDSNYWNVFLCGWSTPSIVFCLLSVFVRIVFVVIEKVVLFLVGIPAKVVAPRRPDDAEERPAFAAYGLSSEGIPDPVARVVDGLLDHVQTLSARVSELEGQLANSEWPGSPPEADESAAKDKAVEGET